MTSRSHFGNTECQAFFMDDGRHFTDYRPRCYAESIFRYENNIMCSHDYRSFLTHNGVRLMKENSLKSWKKNGCGPCKNLCLGIDDTRPGNSTGLDVSKCVPPKDYQRYYGKKAVNSPVLARSAVPSGAKLDKFFKFTTP